MSFVVGSSLGRRSTFFKGLSARGSKASAVREWGRGDGAAGQLGRAPSSRALGQVTDFVLSELSKQLYQSQPHRLGHNSRQCGVSQYIWYIQDFTGYPAGN